MKNKNDHTSTARANKRLAQYQAAAERDGFQKYSSALTAWMKGEYVLVKACLTSRAGGLAHAPEGGQSPAQEKVKAKAPTANAIRWAYPSENKK